MHCYTSNSEKKCPLYAFNAMGGQIPIKSTQSLFIRILTQGGATVQCTIRKDTKSLTLTDKDAHNSKSGAHEFRGILDLQASAGWLWVFGGGAYP